MPDHDHSDGHDHGHDHDHDDGHDHDHVHWPSESDSLKAIAEGIAGVGLEASRVRVHGTEIESDVGWLSDNVVVTSLGVDIGTATTQMMFSRLHMRRETLRPSSRYVVVSREVLWRSDVTLTPYSDDELIDGAALSTFLASGHDAAGITAEDVEVGVVILTGVALLQRNARSIAEATARESGTFVSVTAGHSLEARLSAYGSGSVALSSSTHSRVLCIDIGGGTTKFSLIDDGTVVATTAIGVGGRMLAWDSARRVATVNPMLADVVAGIDGLEPPAAGDVVSARVEVALGARVGDLIRMVITGDHDNLPPALQLTDFDPQLFAEFDVITFAGGVAEYVYGRTDTGYGDLGRAIAVGLADVIGGYVLDDPGQGIRATLVGASQFSVQLSGNTLSIDRAVLPVRDVPVVAPRLDLSGHIDPATVADELRLASSDAYVADAAVMAVTLRFSGDPAYPRLRALAGGLVEGLAHRIEEQLPTVIVFDRDIASTLGLIMATELEAPANLVVLDGLELEPFDFIDVGAPIEPSGVVPVVIKSLLFGQ